MLVELTSGGLRYISSLRNPSPGAEKHTLTGVGEGKERNSTLTKRTQMLKAS